MTHNDRPRVGLFATCLVDLIRPSVGFATARLLQAAGCDVEVPCGQTCCGQPAFNMGNKQVAADLARQFVALFEPFDYVVAPSGSCAGMVKKHYPALLEHDEAWAERARAVCDKTFELTSFLVDVRGMSRVEAQFDGRATYHDSCAGLRELDVKDQPRQLLQSVVGLELDEMAEPEVCCGFGGTFSVKYPDISNAIVSKKAADIASTKAALVVAGDLGCLMNIAGKLTRDGRRIQARHVAEILADMTDTPAIGCTAEETSALRNRNGAER